MMEIEQVPPNFSLLIVDVSDRSPIDTQISCGPLMVATLKTFGSQYQQAKADGKVDLFLRLARMALWRDSPLIVPSHVQDEPIYRAFAEQKLEEVRIPGLNRPKHCRSMPFVRPSRKRWNRLPLPIPSVPALFGTHGYHFYDKTKAVACRTMCKMPMFFMKNLI